MPNIGKVVEAQLNRASISIMTEQDLKAAGAEQAWLRIQQFDPSACIHLLLSLEGAIQGVQKTQLPPDQGLL